MLMLIVFGVIGHWRSETKKPPISISLTRRLLSTRSTSIPLSITHPKNSA